VSTAGLATRSPGWIARRRARGGVAHQRDRVGIGYRSALGPTRLDLASLNHHGYVGGAPGSGKTTLLRLLIEGYPGPVIALDAKGSPELADTVWGQPGHVWEIGGPLKLDLLDPEPAILAQQLLEGEIFTDRATVYRAIAEHAVQRAAWVLRWRAEPRDPARILELLSSPATPAAAIRKSAPPADTIAQRWLVELDSPTATIREAFQTFSERLGTLLDSPAGRSLGTGDTAVQLADILASRGKLLVRLDPRYGALSRKIGAWTLVAMLRVAAELRQARWGGQCLFVIDEPRLLGHEGRHLADLFGTARDAGLGLVVADQGIAGLTAVHPDLPDAVLRSTGWQLIFRQGSPLDAEKMAALFGTVWRDDVSQLSDGRSSVRKREEPRVYPTWLLGLSTGQAWLRVAPVGSTARERVERVVVALPRHADRPRRLALPAPGASSVPSTDGYQTLAEVAPAEGTQDPDRAAVERLVEDADAQGCRGWRGSFDKDGYPRAWWQGRYVRAARLLYTWQQGEIPKGWTLDHTCRRHWCVETAHLEPITRAEHARLEAERKRQDHQHEQVARSWAPLTDAGGPDETDAGGPITASTKTFDIALFKHIGKPQLEAKTVALDELVAMLGRFEVLNDKHRGRCWSPTKYRDGATARGNDGVEAVSCLVFDCDRVSPDPKRLEGVYWIAHTTWSHTPDKPRWRLILPLAKPVATANWRDVWQRARAALCPEADPACKDPSRAYWLPSHPPVAEPARSCRPGALLDMAMLPELPRECARRSTPRVAATNLRRAVVYMARVVDNLAAAAPGGRNAALNHAAWTLGRWVAAGMLEQTAVEDALYAAAEHNGLLADDGERQTWATIRSGLGAGLRESLSWTKSNSLS
jgi:hypothetical protein